MPYGASEASTSCHERPHPERSRGFKFQCMYHPTVFQLLNCISYSQLPNLFCSYEYTDKNAHIGKHSSWENGPTEQELLL